MVAQYYKCKMHLKIINFMFCIFHHIKKSSYRTFLNDKIIEKIIFFLNRHILPGYILPRLKKKS